MSFSPIKFGTDGWRALIAEEYTFEKVRACAQGAARYLAAHDDTQRGLVVGYDTRFRSEDFAAAVAEVLAGNGISVALCDRACPTPVVSYNLLDRQAAGAIVITASHNPGAWNGFKYKPDYAGSASPEVVAELEGHIAEAQASGEIKALKLDDARDRGLVTLIDPRPAYLSHVAGLVDLEAIRGASLDVAVDSMYGAGSGYLAGLIGGGKTKVTELHAERNPLFPGMEQPEPIAQNLQALSEHMRESEAGVGLATDGDADRLGLMDEHGTFLTQLQTLALLALYWLEVRGERGALVKSITTTSMLYRLGEIFDVPVFETPVGFKYIGPVMMRERALLGGEESGGYGFRGHIPERDGIVSGLFILSMMVQMHKKPSELIQYLYDRVGPHYYHRIDIRFDAAARGAVVKRLEAAQPKHLAGSAVLGLDTFDGFRWRLQDGSWALVRFSGTEPLLRVYCETTSPERVQELLQETRKLTGV